jgi:hypothetical protein
MLDKNNPICVLNVSIDGEFIVIRYLENRKQPRLCEDSICVHSSLRDEDEGLLVRVNNDRIIESHHEYWLNLSEIIGLYLRQI